MQMRILVLGAVLLVLVLPSAAGAAITEFPIPTRSTTPMGITAGPDGAMWFTENARFAPDGANQIGRITTPAASASSRSRRPTTAVRWRS